ncbi:hypothetical protein HF086_003909 [Spodoptera exigua]|uniref:WD repeat and HMG-box DNA-binding protein 1 n=1 Tax=Spodoptera exigua TaxID=7107 RepID=A0A922MSH9_SPOEX|nr:hypothetical protein HF086_003909 [Spodoptera exigua]
MKIDSKPLRYAHAEGHTDVCYSEDGQHIITCGNDGDVRIWVDIEDDDPNSHCVGESALAVCYKDKRLYVATDNHVVQAYTYPAFDKDGIVTRFTAPVTQIKSSSKIEVLGCTSENMEAKLCNLEGGAPLFVMTEHTGPVLSIAICPHMKFASTACGDGKLRIWDIDTQKIVKEVSCVPKINTFYAAKIKCAISQCVFSPCGQYLAGSTVAGQVAVWEIGSGACIDITTHPTSHNVTAMAWNPKDNDDIVDDLIENYESDDDNAISLQKIKNETLGLVEQDESRPASRRNATPAPSTVPPQAPFQPSSTPAHLEHRYMCWNDIGIVRCHTAENGESTIDVISLAGPVVCLGAFNTAVLAVYHSTDPGPSDQHLAMDIVALNGRQVRSKTVPVPLTPASKLAWLGTSDVGSPCAYDNTGMLRMYDVSSGVWMPLCDTNMHARGASDSWFIVSVSEATQKVRAILCRGASFPATAPKPIIAELTIQIPLCEMDTEKSQYEEQLVRWAHTTSDVDVKTARETALKLFALACRSEIEQRALELMELLKDDRLLPLAAKYASRLGRVHLADKLGNLAETWEKEADKLNVAQTSHFQELDTQETYDVTNTEQDLNASLIIPQKVKEKKVDADTSLRPVPIKSSPGRARNIFKKKSTNSSVAQSPLSLTERTLVEVHKPTVNSENDDPSAPLEGETFVDWFTRNKSILERQNPELGPSELTRQGIKIFKTVQGKGANNTENGPKRKLDEDTNNTETHVVNAPKQSKLSAFAFQKKS